MHELDELIIELSQNCNLNCTMCGFGSKNNRPEKFMEFELFKTIYNNIGKYAKKIRLNGRGESTIYPNIKEAIDYVGRKNRISLFTNGNYIDDDLNDLFIKFDVELYFSMDSTDRNQLIQIRKGLNFDCLDHNISRMKDKKTKPFIVFTLQETNIDQIVPIAEYAIKKECNLIYNVLRRDEGIEKFVEIVEENVDKIKEYFDEVHYKFENLNIKVFIPNQIAGVIIEARVETSTCGTFEKCPRIDKELCVLYNGDITPCNMFNPYIYGNLNNASIDDIINGEAAKWFKENHKQFYYCQNCACIVR